MSKTIKLFFLIFFLFLAVPIFSQAQRLRDVIGIRVMRNPDFLSPATWYIKNVPNPGKPKSTLVDGYPAVVDGRSYYVEATRVDKINKKTEALIFIMSYNEGGGVAIVNIFHQLIANWSFNSNIESNNFCEKVGPDGDIYCTSDFDCVVDNIDYGPCLSQKGKLRRDIKRIGDLQDLKKQLQKYASTNNSYPALAQGTYLPRYSTSKWPSWNKVLSSDLGIELPQDPLNRFYNDCSNLDGYHPDTCWNEKIRSFACPSGSFNSAHKIPSYLYVYSAKGICSLHCEALTCVGGLNDGSLCKNQDDCPDGFCQYDNPCTKNSDCPDVDQGEYCMKVNGIIDIQFNLETDKDTNIKNSYPLDISSIGAKPGAGGLCSTSDFWNLNPVSFTDIDCCPPLDCSNMGLTGYSCGTYTNNCGNSIDCGTCSNGETCIDGSCCTPSCEVNGVPKECGDDGCGGSCGSCANDFYCASDYTCQEGCVDSCNPLIDSNRCSPQTEFIQECGNCDADSCNEWCDNINCADNTDKPFCNSNGITTTCGECQDGETKSCGSGVGECSSGIKTCVNGIWGVCNGGGSSPEICDGLDNDCDGVIDNISNESIPRVNGGKGVCAGYFMDCIGGIFTFNPNDIPNYENSEITCDGLDNDCDGVIDENQVNIGTPCETGTGICVQSGIYVCNPDNSIGPAICSATVPGLPMPEICNGLDDDCNGTVDDNLTDLLNSPFNDNQVGVCIGSKKACAQELDCNLNNTCWNNNYSSIPDYRISESDSAVRCDGLDNNCDGEIDENCCGDNIVSSLEQCDGTNIPTDCIGLGYTGGVLNCDILNCTYNTSNCYNIIFITTGTISGSGTVYCPDNTYTLSGVVNDCGSGNNHGASFVSKPDGTPGCNAWEGNNNGGTACCSMNCLK